MRELNEQILEVMPKEELDKLSMTYKLWSLQEKKRPSLEKVFARFEIGVRKYRKLVALLGSAEALHQYFGRTVQIENQPMLQLLDEAIQAQRKAIPEMSPKERNELIKILLEVSEIENRPNNQQQTQVNINIDSFLRHQEVIDAE